MRDELDKQLVEKYPKIFKNRYGDMKETLMCFGFECGDGWYQIIDSLCANIQSHIDWRNKQRQQALDWNDKIRAALAGDLTALDSHYSYAINSDELIQEAMEKGPRDVPEEIPQVVAVQVKEKFGGLRFYVDGGDDVVHGMIRMAESWAAVTCEKCGNPGTTRGGGWIRTLCDVHEAEYQERQRSYEMKASGLEE